MKPKISMHAPLHPAFLDLFISTTRLLVLRHNLATTKIEVLEPANLLPGQVRVRIDQVALTASNISYAATGDLLQFWNFFPTDAPWGCTPAWGFGEVTESLCPGVEEGEKLSGFFPMASEVVLEPVQSTVADYAIAFADGMAHRSPLPSIYNQYSRCAADPVHREGQEDFEALLRPLFTAGWLVDDFLEDNAFFLARNLIISSASGKTAYCTAAQLARREGLNVIGLTARHNLDFVKSLGVYSQVFSYDDLDALSGLGACVYLDFAGDAGLRKHLHGKLRQLRYSCLIGASHLDKIGDATGIVGPEPQFLFTPSQAGKRVAQWGVPALMERKSRDWHAFLERATNPENPWMVVEQHIGANAAEAAYASVLQGRGDPRIGHILRF